MLVRKIKQGTGWQEVQDCRVLNLCKLSGKSSLIMSCLIEKPKESGGVSSLKSEGRVFQAKSTPSTSSLRKEGACPCEEQPRVNMTGAKGLREGHVPETKSEEQYRRLINLME